MDLQDKVVIVTGASSGIGKELAIQLAAKGSKLVLAARRSDLLADIARQLQQTGTSVLSVPTDVSQRSQVDHLIEAAMSHFGRIDVLINNAGASLARGTFMDIKETDLRATMDVNFMAGAYAVWAAVPHMRKSGGGQIVFVSSIVGKRGVPRSSAYCASKFAVQGLAESIRPELRQDNIRVITICPPGVDTPFFEVNGQTEPRRYRLHPVGKIAKMIIRACEQEKREVLLTADAKIIHWANVFFPTMVDRLAAKTKGV